MRFLIVTFCLAVLAACGAGAHHGTIKKLPGKPRVSDLMNRLRATNTKDSDGNIVKDCLNMLNVVGSLSQKSQDKFPVFTSNEDLGILKQVKPTSSSNDCLDFNPINDPLSKAAFFLRKGVELKPMVDIRTSDDILASEQVSKLLSISAQKSCESVQYKSAGSQKVLCKSPDSLTVQNGNDEYVKYALGQDSITVTMYMPATLPQDCNLSIPGVPLFSKVVTEILLRPSDPYIIAREFAELLVSFSIAPPRELVAALSSNNLNNGEEPVSPRQKIGVRASSATAVASTAGITVSHKALDEIFTDYAEGQNKINCSKN